MPRLVLLAPLALALALGGCGGPQRAAAPARAADDTAEPATVPASNVAAAVPAEAPLTPVDLPPDFPRAFPLPDGGVVTQATASRDEGSVQADADIAAPQDPAALFAWYQQVLGRQGWNIESRSATQRAPAAQQSLRATRGDSTAEIGVRPFPARAGWSWVSLSVYWSEPKGR